MLRPVMRSYFLRAAALLVLGYLSYWSLYLARAGTPGPELDPENPDLFMQLGQQAENDGARAAAEQNLLRAAAISRLYQPRYLLAQFYFRHPSGDRFWTWSRAALDTAPGDAGVILQLAWHAHPDAAWLWNNAIPHRPEIARQYLAFLTSSEEWPGASMIAHDL